MNKMNKGFTLIELLVVIAILAILAAIALTSFTSAQKSARDTQRKSDLNQYRIALENYALNNNGKYPVGDADRSDLNTGIFLNPGLIIPTYLPAKIPDPQEGLTGCIGTNCLYWYRGSTSSYVLYASLEIGVTGTPGIDTWAVCSDGRSGTLDCREPWNGAVCNLKTCPL